MNTLFPKHDPKGITFPNFFKEIKEGKISKETDVMSTRTSTTSTGAEEKLKNHTRDNSNNTSRANDLDSENSSKI